MNEGKTANPNKGEIHVLHQVKEAYLFANNRGDTNSELNIIFRELCKAKTILEECVEDILKRNYGSGSTEWKCVSGWNPVRQSIAFKFRI